MTKHGGKPTLKETTDKLDLIRMQTEVGLMDSMLRSKTLTSIVVGGILFFSAFFYFLYKVAGA